MSRKTKAQKEAERARVEEIARSRMEQRLAALRGLPVEALNMLTRLAIQIALGRSGTPTQREWIETVNDAWPFEHPFDENDELDLELEGHSLLEALFLLHDTRHIMAIWDSEKVPKSLPAELPYFIGIRAAGFPDMLSARDAGESLFRMGKERGFTLLVVILGEPRFVPKEARHAWVVYRGDVPSWDHEFQFVNWLAREYPLLPRIE